VLVLCSLLFGAWLVFDQAWPAEGGRSATIKAAQTIAAPRPRPASPAPAPAEDGQDLQDDHGTVMTWASVE
jgi:hypothetical protein